jgi:tetratricopeptide (TPR) repeat protein
MAECLAQKSVVDLFRSDRELADRYYANGEIQDAIRLYERSDKPGTATARLARGYFQVKEYRKCVDAYNNFRNDGKKMEFTDYVNYAEAQLALKNYSEAQAYYQKALELQPSHDWIVKKMWRISNMHYLYEDSIHFSVRSLSINTPDAEWGGIPFESGILFVSNRPSGSPIMQVDAATDQSFYKVYFAQQQRDTLLKGWSRYAEPALYTKIPYGIGILQAWPCMTRILK